MSDERCVTWPGGKDFEWFRSRNRVGKREFDDRRRKREVSVDITTWRGLCPGATHYYATIKAEENHFLDPVEDAWIRVSDDPDRELEMKYEDERLYAVIDWIRDTLAKHFTGPRFKKKVRGGATDETWEQYWSRYLQQAEWERLRDEEELKKTKRKRRRKKR